MRVSPSLILCVIACECGQSTGSTPVHTHSRASHAHARTHAAITTLKAKAKTLLGRVIFVSSAVVPTTILPPPPVLHAPATTSPSSCHGIIQSPPPCTSQNKQLEDDNKNFKAPPPLECFFVAESPAALSGERADGNEQTPSSHYTPQTCSETNRSQERPV